MNEGQAYTKRWEKEGQDAKREERMRDRKTQRRKKEGQEHKEREERGTGIQREGSKRDRKIGR